MYEKVLVKVIAPELDYSCDVFLPINEQIWKLIRLVSKSIYDLCGVKYSLDNNYVFMNKNTSIIYNLNSILIDTDIRNGTELILLSEYK